MRHAAKGIMLTFGAAMLVAGCADSNLAQLEQEVTEIRQRPGNPPEVSVPELPQVTHEAYQGNDLRNPFIPRMPEAGAGAGEGLAEAPDGGRAPEVLEQYDRDALSLVGMMEFGSQRSALIESPDGHVHNVKVGAYLGKDHGQVKAITTRTVELVETVKSGDAWTRRQVSMELSEDAS